MSYVLGGLLLPFVNKDRIDMVVFDDYWCSVLSNTIQAGELSLGFALSLLILCITVSSILKVWSTRYLRTMYFASPC